MNRVLRNFLTCLVASFMISAMFSLTMINGIMSAFNKENIEKCLSNINIESILASQNNDYNEVINNYVNDTGMSKEDVQKIFESGEYSNLVGNYVLESDEFDFSKYFEEDIGKEDNLDSETLSDIGIDGSTMTKDEIKKMFDSLGITYKESDINYFKNSLTTDVAPKVQNKIDEVVGQSTKDLKKINIDGIKNIFTNKTINSNKIVIVLCAIIILILNYKNVSFLSIYAINSGLVCVVLKIFEVLINKINEMVPIEYASMVGTFINPLTNQFKKDFNMLIWIVIICVLLQLVMYILINKTEYGDKLSFLKYGNNKVSEEEQYKNMYDEFNSDFGTLADEIDFSQFDDNNTIASAYDSKELKDITFSTGVYVHNEHNK